MILKAHSLGYTRCWTIPTCRSEINSYSKSDSWENNQSWNYKSTHGGHSSECFIQSKPKSWNWEANI